MEKFTIGEPWETDTDGNSLAITNRRGYNVCYMNLYLAKGRQIAYASHIVDCVNGCAEIENPGAVNKLLKALKSVLSLIDENILVRNIDRDWDSQYFTKQSLCLVQTLKEVQQAITEAEGTKP